MVKDKLISKLNQTINEFFTEAENGDDIADILLRKNNEIATLTVYLSSLSAQIACLEERLDLLEEQTHIPIVEMPYGKHKGKPLEELPIEYVRWLEKYGALNQKIKTCIENLSKRVCYD